MTIEDYENDKTRYLQLKSTINSIINDLNYFTNNTTNIKTKLSSIYSIDDSNSPVLDRIIKLDENSDNIRDYLLITIIPAIDAALKNCDEQISKLEAEAQAAAEEAARAAASRSSSSSESSSSESSSSSSSSSSTSSSTTVRTTRSC